MYHGSIVPKIESLYSKSKLHNSNKQVVYLTENVPYALLYIWDSERNTKRTGHVTAWIKDGIVYYEEQFANQLKSFYDGVQGYLYSVKKNDSYLSLKQREAIFYSEKM